MERLVPYTITRLFPKVQDEKLYAIVSTDEASYTTARQYYQPLLENMDMTVSTVRDITEHLLEVGKLDLREYSKYLVGASFTGSEGSVRSVIAWYNGEYYHTAIIALNLVHTTLTRCMAGDGASSISLKVRWQEGVEESATYSITDQDRVQAMVERVIFLSMAISTMTSSFGIFPVVDRVSMSKHLQLMTGLTGKIYWIANFIFDFCFYTTNTTIFMSILLIFYTLFAMEMLGEQNLLIVQLAPKKKSVALRFKVKPP